MKPGIQIAVEWSDADMLQLRISASNGIFSGATSCYASLSIGKEMGDSIRGFPRTPKDTRTLQLLDNGCPDGGDVKITLFCVDGAGHPCAQITFKTEAGCRPPLSGEASFIIDLETAAVDQFAEDLMLLENNKSIQLEAAK